MRIAAILIALLIALLISVPVYAFDPPAQDATDNATDVVLWYGENLTIASANLTGTIDIDQLEESLTAASEAGAQVIADSLEARLNDITSLIIYLLVMFGLAAFAYAKNDKPMFFVSGLAFIVYGFTFETSSLLFSILLVLAGFLLCVRAFTSKGKGNE